MIDRDSRCKFLVLLISRYSHFFSAFPRVLSLKSSLKDPIALIHPYRTQIGHLHKRFFYPLIMHFFIHFWRVHSLVFFLSANSQIMILYKWAWKNYRFQGAFFLPPNLARRNGNVNWIDKCRNPQCPFFDELSSRWNISLLRLIEKLTRQVSAFTGSITVLMAASSISRASSTRHLVLSGF